MGQHLWRMKRDLKSKEYGIFLSILGWVTSEARKYINLAKTFDGFEVSQLIGVELNTLFKLCGKTYQGVVEQMREIDGITQEGVSW